MVLILRRGPFRYGWPIDGRRVFPFLPVVSLCSRNRRDFKDGVPRKGVRTPQKAQTGMSFLGITWRSAFLALASFVVVSLLIWPVLWRADKTHLDQLGAEWTRLFELCRTSVELDVPLMTASSGSFGRGMTIQTVASEGKTTISFDGWFAAQEEAHGDGKNFRRGCSVILADEKRLLDKDEIATLMLAFVELREQLAAAGTHLFVETAPVQPSTMLAFSLRDGNAAGCSTIAYISMDVSTRRFITEIGEQSIRPCLAR